MKITLKNGPKITKNKNKLTIPSFVCKRGIAPEVVIDLAPHAGEYVRVWLDENMTYSTDKHKNHYWQVAELQVPAQMYQSKKTGKIDEHGFPITISEPIPLELPEIRLFDIEEGGIV